MSQPKPHEFDHVDCWCEPIVTQPCPWCSHLTDMHGKPNVGCTDCNWSGWVKKFDEEGPFLVVHRTNTGLRILEVRREETAMKHRSEDPAIEASAKALPCPWCGSLKLKVLFTDDEAHRSTWVYCGGCQASGPSGDSEVEAVRKWNQRVLSVAATPEPKVPKFPKLSAFILLILSLLIRGDK